MAPPSPRPWTVLPHGPLQKIEDNLWTVDGTLPRGRMNRRMTVVKRSDGRLVFHNAVPLQEMDMKALEAWGEPGYLLVPNGFHRLDIHAFKQRYPKMKLLCPAPQDARVRQVVPVDGHFDALSPDPAVRAEVLDGSKVGEAVFVVTSHGRVSLLFGDTLMNIPRQPGFDMFIMRLLGSVGDLRVTLIARLVMVGDKAALRRHLEKLSALPGLERLIVSHGDDVTQNAATALRAACAKL